MPCLLMAAMIGQLFLRHIFNWEEISRGWFLFRNLTKDRPTFQSNIKSRYCHLELQRITHIYSIYLYSCMYVWKQTCYVLHMSIVKSVKAKSASQSAINSWKLWHSQSHKLEVSLRHTSQHKQFGTCDVMSIPLHTRQMLLLLCHFNISHQLENLRDPVALRQNVN